MVPFMLAPIIRIPLYLALTKSEKAVETSTKRSRGRSPGFVTVLAASPICRWPGFYGGHFGI